MERGSEVTPSVECYHLIKPSTEKVRLAPTRMSSIGVSSFERRPFSIEKFPAECGAHEGRKTKRISEADSRTDA